MRLDFLRNSLQLQEDLITLSRTEDSEGSAAITAGQVRWRFHLQWSPGGEEPLWPNMQEELKHPWWHPPRPVPPPAGISEHKLPKASKLPQLPPPEPEDDFPTTSRYRTARVQHHEYQFRHHPIQEVYYYIVPAHLMTPFSSQMSDASFPCGWVCTKCGRMNFQKAIRHRKCASQVCKVCS